MGLWQTGYLDKIDTGYSGHRFSNRPKEYTCQYCREVFLNHDDLLQHRFQAHSFERPIFLINGEEISTSRKYLSKKIFSQDIRVISCTKILFGDEEISPNDLGTRLANEQNGLKKLSLINNDLSSSYELLIQIPQQEDLNEIDLRFFEATSSGILSRSVIDSFADASNCYADASRYLDGIVGYLYGILAKDQKGGSCLDFRQYREKYNQSLDALHDYDTQLAVTISAIINLNFNVFDRYAHLLDVPWLHASFSRFNKILYQYESDMIGQNYAGIKPNFKIPLDSFTEKIINWSLHKDSELAEIIKNIISNIDGQAFPPDDRFKLRVIAADFYHRNGKNDIAGKLAKPAVNDVFYGEWAARMTQ